MLRKILKYACEISVPRRRQFYSFRQSKICNRIRLNVPKITTILNFNYGGNCEAIVTSVFSGLAGHLLQHKLPLTMLEKNIM